MKRNMKKSVYIALSIVGAIVGVGFASGKEVFTFFARFGWLSIIYCFVASVLFSVFSYLIFINQEQEVYNMQINKKRKTSKIILKKHTKTIKNTVFRVILFICQVSICSAMFAGVDCLFRSFGVSYFICFFIKLVLLCVSCVFLVFFKNRLSVFNFSLSLLLFCLVFLIFVSNILNGVSNIYNAQSVPFWSFVFPIIYVGMNVFTVYPLLENIGDGYLTKREKFFVALFIGVFVFVALSLVCCCILLFGGSMNFEMPMLKIAKEGCCFLSLVYAIVIILGLVTTLFSTGYGAAKIINKKMVWSVSVIGVMIASFVLSFFGFSLVVDVIYPVLGLVCLLFLIFDFFIF